MPSRSHPLRRLLVIPSTVALTNLGCLGICSISVICSIGFCSIYFVVSEFVLSFFLMQIFASLLFSEFHNSPLVNPADLQHPSVTPHLRKLNSQRYASLQRVEAGLLIVT